MNPLLQEILATGKIVADDGREIELHSYVSADECAFLQGIVGELMAERSVEIGLAYGISAMAICDSLTRSNRTRHIVIDPCQRDDWQGHGLRNLERSGYGELIEFIGQPSHLALPQLELRGEKIDFAFIDGMHTFDHTLIDFFFLDRLLRVGGVVAIDDANFAAIRKVCRFILANRSYRVLRCLGAEDPGRLAKHRMAAALAKFIPAARRLLAPEVLQPDHTFGVVAGSRCVALVKESDDQRAWNFHRIF